MVKVDAGTPLCELSCRVCHQPVGAGDSVLVAYRKGEPQIIHAHVCFPPPRSDAAQRASIALPL